jgi:hypothetical protein
MFIRTSKRPLEASAQHSASIPQPKFWLRPKDCHYIAVGQLSLMDMALSKHQNSECHLDLPVGFGSLARRC